MKNENGASYFGVGMIVGMILLALIVFMFKAQIGTHKEIKKITYTKNYIKVQVDDTRYFIFDKTDTLKFNVGDKILIRLEKDTTK